MNVAFKFCFCSNKYIQFKDIYQRLLYVTDFMTQQKFSHVCTKWKQQARKSDLYNLVLALFTEFPVEPSTTVAMVSSHWLYNNSDSTTFLPYSPMYALEPH